MPSAAARQGSTLRWVVVGLIFGASVLNYVDRQTLSILAPTVQSDLRLSDQDYAGVLNWFLIAYTVSYLIAGRLVDRLGVRASFALFVIWWSLAEIATGWVRSLAGLGAARFLLGLGEAGNWVAAPKAVAHWFSARERSLAIGLYTLGGTVGATLAPLLVIKLAAWHGWQGAFLMTGLAGLLWVLPWLALGRSEAAQRARRSRFTFEEDSTCEEATAAMAEADPTGWKVGLRREVWLLMAARLLTDPVWYFYQFWFAKYLHDERGLVQGALSRTWLIFLAADVGAIAGGWLSGQLIRRGEAPAASRLWIMLGCAVLAPCSALLPAAGGLGWAVGLGMVAVFAHMAWLINVSSLVVDLVPERTLGTAFGIVAAGSAAGGIIMNWAVGQMLSRYSYTPAFIVAGCLHPLALALLWRGCRSRPALTPELVAST